MTHMLRAIGPLLALSGLVFSMAPACDTATSDLLDAPPGWGPSTLDLTGDSWVIGVYMAADNNLDPSASKDLIEMLAAEVPDHVEVLVYIDRTEPGTYRRKEVPGLDEFGEARLMKLTPSGFEILEHYGEVDSASVAEIHKFATLIANHPAERRAMVMWNHGSTNAYATDETNVSHSLHLNYLVKAFRVDLNDPSKGWHFVDFLGFDTCLMGSQESLFALGGLTSVYVASAELEPGDGWDYTGWLGADALKDSSTLTASKLGEAAVKSFGDYYTTNAHRTGGLKVTLAAWRADFADAAADFQRVADDVAALQSGSESAKFQQVVTSSAALAAAYGARSGAQVLYVDLGDFYLGVANDGSLGQLAADARAAVDVYLDHRIASFADPRRRDVLGLLMHTQYGPAQGGDRGAAAQMVDAAEEAGVALGVNDHQAPELVLSVGSHHNPQFVDANLTASDDVGMVDTRLSLGTEFGDDLVRIWSSFAIPEATGQTELPKAPYGLPLAGMSISGIGTTPGRTHLATLRTEDGAAGLGIVPELVLMARFLVGREVHDGTIILAVDDIVSAYVPVGVTIVQSDGTALALPWEDVLFYGDVQIAPVQQIYDSANGEIFDEVRAFVPANEATIDFYSFQDISDIRVYASSVDLGENVTVISGPVP